MIRVAGITEESTVDGPGIRFVIFVQGCLKSCPGCHNPQSQNMGGGTRMRVSEIMERIRRNPLLDGVTLSGGEPFLQAKKLVPLARQCHEIGLSVMVYTGYLHEEILENPAWHEFLNEIDVLVDGPFDESRSIPKPPFRGSWNQRVIELKR